MRQLLAPSAALAAILIPVPALADLSALDVWDSWKSYMEDSGYTVEIGSQDVVGSSLILRNVEMKVLSDEADMRATLSNIDLRELGDGRVEITMANDIPVTLNAKGEEEVDIAMVMRQSGLMITASGDPAAITYDFEAQTMSVDFDKFVVEGEQVEPELSMVMTGIEGKSAMREDGGWHAEGGGTVDAVNANFSFTDSESGETVTGQITMADLSSQSTTFIGEGYDPADPASFFGGDMMAKGNVTMGNSLFQISASGEENFDLTASAGSQSFDFELADGSIGYSADATNVAYNFSSPDMPFPPINVSIEQSGGAFQFPLGASDEMQDFRMMFSLQGLTTEEFLWGMIDPAGMLPRDPANLRVDVSGKLRSLVDLFDEEAVEEYGDEMPFELGNMDINDVSLSIAGASVDAVGAFTFDNSDLETFDGLPAPTGSVDINIYGINGLIDTLVQMGLIPDDQAMGARMMMGAFARPGDGEDHLTSQIEVNRDGSFFANGMQLQ